MVCTITKLIWRDSPIQGNAKLQLVSWFNPELAAAGTALWLHDYVFLLYVQEVPSVQEVVTHLI